MAHATVVKSPCPASGAATTPAEAAWVPLDEAKRLAFDHAEILATARTWLESRAQGEGGRRGMPSPSRVADQAERSASQRISNPFSRSVVVASSVFSMCIATAARPCGWTISG